MDSNNQTWVSAHLFYSEPWEEFLSAAVKPFVANLQAEKLVTQYFFIRYWERGPHIRLRLKADPAMDETIRARLLAHFTEYFAEHPSAPGETRKSRETDFPNNSVQFITYEPETVRYGGEFTIGLSENLFEHSSSAVLHVIPAYLKTWNYKLAMGFAIQMNLVFLLRASRDAESLSACLDYIAEGAVNFSLHRYREQPDYPERRQKLISTYTRSFELQKATLLPVVQNIFDYFNRGRSENEWLDKWIQNSGSVLDQLSQLNAEGKVLSRSGNYGTPGRPETLFSIYVSYVHMTNNRLGIRLYDEPFLAFLLKSCVEEINAKTA